MILQFKKHDIDELYRRIDAGADANRVIGLFYNKYLFEFDIFTDSCMLKKNNGISLLLIKSCQHIINNHLFTHDEAVEIIEKTLSHLDSGDIKSELYILFNKAIKRHLAYRKKHNKFPFPLGMYVEKFLVFGLRDFISSQYTHYARFDYREIEEDELITELNDSNNEERLWLEQIFDAYKDLKEEIDKRGYVYEIIVPVDRFYLYEKSLGYHVFEIMEKLRNKEKNKSNIFKSITSRIKQFKSKYAGKKTDAGHQNTCATN
jgi:hypothetical protein